MANFSGIMAHGPPATQPRFLFFLKIAIIALSVVVLAIAAYAISLFGQLSYYGGAGAPGLLIFTVIWTWITYGVFLFFELKAPHFFYRIIAVVLWALSIIFWLSGWALAASNAATYLSYSSYTSRYGSILYQDDWFKKEGSALAGCAGIGALIWILIIVHFVFFVRACITDTTSTGAELGHVGHKHEATGAPAPAAAPAGAPVQYQAQPVYQQQQTYPQQPQQAYPQQQAYPTQ